MLVHVLTKFRSNWAIFYLFMTFNIHPFFTKFFVDHSLLYPLYLIINLQIAITFEPLIRFM